MLLTKVETDFLAGAFGSPHDRMVKWPFGFAQDNAK